MIKSKNLMSYLIVLVLVVFSASYFIVATRLSHAFPDNEVDILYETKINNIGIAAKNYAEGNLDIFKESSTVYLTVSDLVGLGYIHADDDAGNVKDPSSNVKVLNDTKIRLTYKDAKVTYKVLDK